MFITDSETQQMLFYMYAILVGNSILIYDHMVTLHEEIAFIWRRPKALSAILFLLNRYVALLGNICGLVVDFVPISDESCLKYTLFKQFALFLQGMVVCIIMAIRTYALYGCSKHLLTWLLIVMIPLAGLASAGNFGQISSVLEILPGVGCNETYSTVVAARTAMSYVALFVYDLFILILTVYRVCNTRCSLRLSLVTSTNIIDVIFRDGAMYFGAMALSNVLNILTFYFGSVGLRGSLSTFTGCISVTLVSRLMLNLHKTIDSGILSTPARDDGPSLAVLTTRINLRDSRWEWKTVLSVIFFNAGMGDTAPTPAATRA
ncbi:hypothetical protein EDB19DRAFT_2034903 [Suillus lakei]|nr:hypothetical protein EDB19DRAFT_2034903 [Suillus lakei]